jgi:hypothetical protein
MMGSFAFPPELEPTRRARWWPHRRPPARHASSWASFSAMRS